MTRRRTRRRPGPPPLGPCDDATLLEHIKRAITESRFTGEGYRKIWAKLRFAGIRASPGRVRRLMGANGLSAPHRLPKRPGSVHDGKITTEAVDVMWGTDMTQTVTLLTASFGLPPLSKRSCKSAPNMDGAERIPPGVSTAGFD